ncbi:ABC transporter ATP-binding protein/permease [Brevibacterium casei]|uniref:ATP-binding cassette, subfamily B n=1 Tax=Brevibacterium casei CIP 102111 TaxID=1255625 RepID=A0A2H1J595_9MICO|nr:ABC transporter ATP-binding protein [Brevibacterium casei]SIH04886.1 ABC transporter-like protein [Mycobacteroides abscessus subsp. abscessus]MBE4693232.1 ABC transporter ATP-binding protein [Brevibacterium casei]MBY3576355.1 ABC transporter ATP-binding protein [Brevibacterium casei]MCT1766438.1 ABC transporter ATP-binding protein/permease [Brevibacterium casei]MCT2183674.1 ABC transporter ATP-binding protein/permease [Brevibacterium casei]
MALLRLTLKFAKSYWLFIVFVVVLQLASTIAALYLPSLNARIIDEGVAEGDTDFIWSTGMTMLIVCLVQVITAVTAIYFGARSAMGVGRDIRRAIYSRVDELSTLEVGRFGSATLITRNTNDVQQVQMLVLMTLNFMVSTPIMCIGGIIMAFREDPGLSWLVWVSVPVLFVVVGILVVLLMPLFRRMQDQVDDINGVLREQISGIRVIRAFVREPFEADRYADANRALTETSVKVGNLFVLMFPAIMMILHLATAAVLWFGGHRVDAGVMEVGSLTAFLQYLLQILVAVMMGVFMVMMIPRAVVCAERICEVLDTKSSMVIPDGVAELPRRGELEFRNVTFGYPGAEVPVLEDLTFTAQPGTTTAIIGATGSGKSTIVGLIPRLIDPQAGEVLIDGVPVSAFNRRQLAQLVGLVPQKPYLFSGTIASNLRFGSEFADDAQLWEALETAQAADFVAEKPDRLEESVSQGGTNFSGGQRQRLCIARALAAKPLVYVFDDSFSALDVATDARLREALGRTTGESTVVVVAQRVSTIRDADQILVLDDGKIVGRGTHDELLETNATYQEIVESQLTAEGVN